MNRLQTIKSRPIESLIESPNIEMAANTNQPQKVDVLFIRHGQKEYRNGEATADYCLDPDLTVEGRNEAYRKFYRLCERFGTPERIVSSPYLRTRETAQIAQTAIADYVYNLESTLLQKGLIPERAVRIVIPIHYDTRISEYLGNHRHRDINKDLRPLTLIHNPVHGENYGQYSLRVREFVNSGVANGWYISHGIVLQSVALFNNIRLPYPKEVSGFGYGASGVVYF